MAKALTYERILEIFSETDKRLDTQLKKSRQEFDERLKREAEERKKEAEERKKEAEERKKEAEERKKRWEEFDARIEKEVAAREAELKISREELDACIKKKAMETEAEMKKSRREFNKRLGELTGRLGRFVEGLVEPKLLELFCAKGIPVSNIMHNVSFYGEGFDGAEIDLMLLNAQYVIAVEVKTTLEVEDVKEHIRRLDRLQQFPCSFIHNKILLGAVAGMRIESGADKFAYRCGLYVLRQKGAVMEIANDHRFIPREWVVD